MNSLVNAQHTFKDKKFSFNFKVWKVDNLYVYGRGHKIQALFIYDTVDAPYSQSILPWSFQEDVKFMNKCEELYRFMWRIVGREGRQQKWRMCVLPLVKMGTENTVLRNADTENISKPEEWTQTWKSRQIRGWTQSRMNKQVKR